MANIQFLGAAGTVTGSKHLINTGNLQVLVDCGLFQGLKQWRERNWQPLPIPANRIDAVILTHAHLDHSGWIPRLVKQGFRGKIYATPASIDLCGILLPDAGHLQEEDAGHYNRNKSSKHNPALPLYTLADAQNALKYFEPVAFQQSKQLSSSLTFRFVPAAHITGSSMAEITIALNGSSKQLLFTGDIGRVRDHEVSPGKVQHSGPTEGESADILVMESTYGNRLHPTSDVRPELAKLISDTAARGGTVLIPAFAVERTQKLLFLLKELMESKQIPRVPVHIDSPMAIEAIEIFLKHSEEYTPDTRQLIARYGSPLQWNGFFFDQKQEDSRKLNEAPYPMIIVSASGMVTGGRIVHHLIHRLAEPKNTVIFIGFQAQGTRGALIKSGASSIKMFGEEVQIRAQIAALEQFSDHADTPELLEWLGTFKQQPSQTYLVHGEPAAAAALRDAITQKLGWKVDVAQWLQKVDVN
jgi:metallo-beta-lactamase family protein